MKQELEDYVAIALDRQDAKIEEALTHLAEEVVAARLALNRAEEKLEKAHEHRDTADIRWDTQFGGTLVVFQVYGTRIEVRLRENRNG